MTARRAFGRVMVGVVLATALAAAPALAQESEPPPAEGETSEAPVEVVEEVPAYIEIVFPVVGPSYFAQSFGDCRDGCTRSHQGNDILTYGWKGVPVVAAHDGRVVSARTDGALAGCSLTIRDDDGWTTRYVHLNMDTPGTDIEGSLCFAPGIEVGADVVAGQLLGWVGDSGNAEHTQPHLHFEIRTPDDEPIDPWLSLDLAHRISFRLVDTADVSGFASATFASPADVVYVVSADNLVALSARFDLLEVPVVPIDPASPIAALTSVRALSPERIVVFADGPSPSYVDDLRALAPLVEVASLSLGEEDATLETPVSIDEQLDASTAVSAPAPEASSDESEIEPVTHPQNTEPTDLTIGISRYRGIRSVDGDDAGPLLLFRAPIRLNEQPGSPAPEHPGLDANRDGLWWQTADGWWLSESVDDHPDTMALVTDPQNKPWTVAFLTSRAAAPPMPLWFHQPTSRTSKSL